MNSKSLDQALAEAFLKAARSKPLWIGGSKSILQSRANCCRRWRRPTISSSPASRKVSDANSQVPEVGEPLADFCLTDSEGKLVELAAMLDKSPLVISFNRGPWCDYCGLELHSLGRAYPDIVAAGGEVVSIVPETAKYARNLQATRGVPFRVLTDMDLGYALSLGLVFWVGQKVMDMYRGFGIDLAHFQGNGGWFLPIPATLVVGRDGLVKARFLDPDFRHRMRTEDIVKAVREAA